MIIPHQEQKKYTFPLVLLFLYVVVEYARPAILSAFRPALFLQAALLLFLLRNLSSVKEVLRDKYFKLYLVLLAEMMIHGPIAINSFMAYHQWLLMISYLIFSLSFCLFIDSFEKLQVFIAFFLSIHALAALDQILTGGVYLGYGVLGDTNDLALDMNVVAPLSFFFGLSYRGLKRLLLWSVTILFVVANVSAVSRGGFVGLVAIALFCWLNTKGKMKSLLVLLAAAGIFVMLIPEGYKKEIRSITQESSQTGTGRDRVELWKVAWRVFTHNPFLGVGQGNLTYRLGDYQYDEKEHTYWQRSMSGRAVHSIYFTLLPELGILGTVIYILMLFDIYRRYRLVNKQEVSSSVPEKTRVALCTLNNMTTGLFVGIIGFLASGIFLSVLYYPQFYNFIALIIVTRTVRKRMGEIPTSSPIPANSAVATEKKAFVRDRRGMALG